MKRTLEKVDHEKGEAGTIGGTGGEPKKKRRARIPKNFEVIPLDRTLCDLFRINSTISECIKRLKAEEVLQQLRRGEVVNKPVIPITKDLKMTVHNVVLTTELYERLHPEDEDKELQDNIDGALSSAAALNNMKDDAPDKMDNDDDDGENVDDADLPLEDIAIDGDNPNEPADGSTSFRIIQDFVGLGDRVSQAMPIFDMINHFNRSNGDDVNPSARVAKELLDPSPVSPTRRYYEIPLRCLIYYLRHYGAQLNPRRFTAIILRNDELSGASLIFGTVKLVSTGCARFELALMLMQNALDKIRAAGYDDFDDPVPCLRNIVSNGRFDRQICTNLMTIKYSDCCKSVVQFPGTMIINPQKTGKRVTLIFESGEICHSGARTIEEIHNDLVIIYPMILNCIKNRANDKLDKECARILKMEDDKPAKGEALESMKQRLSKLGVRKKRTPTASATSTNNNNNNAST